MVEFEPRQHHNSFCTYCLENMREGVYLDVNYEDGSSEALDQWCSIDCLEKDLRRRLCGEKVV